MASGWEERRIRELNDDIDRTTRELEHLDQQGRWARHHIRWWRHRIEFEARHTARSLRMMRIQAEDVRREARRGGHGARGAVAASAGAAREERRGGGGMAALEGEDAIYGVVTAGALGVLFVVGLILATGHVGARLHSGTWPSYELRDVPELLSQFARNLDDPAQAWARVAAPGSAEVPGPMGWWGTFLLLAVPLAIAARLMHKAGWLSGGAKSEESTWATRPQLRHLRMRRHRSDDRLVVGTQQGQKLGVADSLLVVGPRRSGRSGGIAVPALLEWRGPAIVASSDPGVVDHTIGWRSHHGDVHVFDPAGLSRHRRSGWNPLQGCTTWPDAVRRAQQLSASAADGEEVAAAGLGGSAMAMALAPFLYTAAVEGRPITDVAQWIARQERDEVLEALQRRDPTAARVHETTFYFDDLTRALFFRLMYRALGVYTDPMVAESARQHEIEAAALLDGGQHTLYLPTPPDGDARFRPLFATLVREILAVVDDRYAAQGVGPNPALLVVVDDAAGSLSPEDLGGLAATGAARGVQLVTLVEEAAPPEARAYQSLLVLPGAALAPGVVEEGALGELAEGEAALWETNRPPVRVRLRRWESERELRKRATIPQDALPPRRRPPTSPPQPSAPPPLIPAPPGGRSYPISVAVADQAHAWQKRTGQVFHDPDPTPTNNISPFPR